MCPLGPVRAAAAVYGRLVDVPVSCSIRCRKVAFSAACRSKSCCKASTLPQCRCCSVLNCAENVERLGVRVGRAGDLVQVVADAGEVARALALDLGCGGPRRRPRPCQWPARSRSGRKEMEERGHLRRPFGTDPPPERPSSAWRARWRRGVSAEDRLPATSWRGAGATGRGGRTQCIGHLSDAQPLQVLDRSPHLAGVPRRPVVALRQTLNAGAPPHGDQLDCEMLRAVVLAQGKEPLRHCSRWKLVHERIG